MIVVSVVDWSVRAHNSGRLVCEGSLCIVRGHGAPLVDWSKQGAEDALLTLVSYYDQLFPSWAARKCPLNELVNFLNDFLFYSKLTFLSDIFICSLLYKFPH